MKTSFHIDVYACIAGALFILLIPAKWLGAVCFAALIHEIGHIIAVYLIGGEIIGIHIHSYGVIMETENIDGIGELLCALAGPAASFSIMTVYRWMPLTAICGIIQGTYNLLPVYPLDGGRAVYALSRRFYENKIVSTLLELASVSAICVFVFAICKTARMRWPAACMASILLERIIPRKTPCKE